MLLEGIQEFKKPPQMRDVEHVDLKKSSEEWSAEIRENMEILRSAMTERDPEAIELIDKSIAMYTFAEHEFEKSITDLNELLKDPSLSRISQAVLANDRIKLEQILTSMREYTDAYQAMLSKEIETETRTLH